MQQYEILENGCKYRVEVHGGIKYWYLAGTNIPHRSHGLPAREYPDVRNNAYILNGEYHRRNGPAVDNSWYYCGTRIFINSLVEYNQVVFDVTEFGIRYTVVYQYGDTDYFRRNTPIKHREQDLPAKISKSGTKFYYLNNKLERQGDQPAIVYANGDNEYVLNDKTHRLNGPAVIINGEPSWFYHGERAPVNSQADFERWIKLSAFG